MASSFADPTFSSVPEASQTGSPPPSPSPSPSSLSSPQREQRGSLSTEASGSLERIEKEKEAEVAVTSNFTRRKAVIVVVILLLGVGGICVLVSAVISSQIQNVVGSGPSPPIDTSLPSTAVLGNLGTAIPQGGSLISRPEFNYGMNFINDIYLVRMGTQKGAVLWRANITGLTSSSKALLQLTEYGVLVVVIPGQEDTPIWKSQETNNPFGSYTFQVTEFDTNSGTQNNQDGGQLQILDSSGNVVWYVGGSDPDGAPDSWPKAETGEEEQRLREQRERGWIRE